MLYPVQVYALIVAALTAFLTLLFFVGPSFACRTAGSGVMLALQTSMGRIPGYCARLCCIWFLVAWTAAMISLPVTWQLRVVLGRDAPALSSVVAIVLLTYLFVTSLQNTRTAAKLALFTNKLAVAVLIAAAIRVCDGWPAVMTPFPDSGHPRLLDLWYGIGKLSFYIAPLAFLAAEYVGPKQARTPIRKLATMGLALPICGGLFMVGLLEVATHASTYYQPSLEPNIAMALWGKAAWSSLPARMMLTAMTVFGAVRFGVRALSTSIALPWLGHRGQRIVLACVIAPIAWLSINPWGAALEMSLELSVATLTVFAGVLTADAVSRYNHEPRGATWIDWVGTSAAIAGLITAASVNALAEGAGWETWFHPWLFPSYGVSFATCLCGRVLQGRRIRSESGSLSVGADETRARRR